MFNTIRAVFSRSYVRYTLFTLGSLHASLATAGAVWMMVEVAGYFQPSLNTTFRHFWHWIAFVAVCAVLYQRRPITGIRHKLTGRDIHIAIRVGDLFSVRGAYVIPTNTTFDTNLSFISVRSIQGQFTRRFYDSQVANLDRDIARSLEGIEPVESLDSKRKGKTAKYGVGTVALLRHKGVSKKRDLAFYLLAATHINEHGTCLAVSFEQIKVALAELWDFTSRCGDHEPLVMGLIGTGHGRTTATRENVAREIITSFIAACSSSAFCDDFTLVIHPADLRRYSINLYELGDFLRHVCQYASWGGKDAKGTGTPVE